MANKTYCVKYKKTAKGKPQALLMTAASDAAALAKLKKSVAPKLKAAGAYAITSLKEVVKRKRKAAKKKKTAPKRNPVKPAARSKAIAAARDMFETFTGHDAKQVRKVKVPKVTAGAVIGRCDGILYTTKRDGKTEKYIHRFRAKSAPSLVVANGGKRFLSVGGAFQFGERGFVDK